MNHKEGIIRTRTSTSFFNEIGTHLTPEWCHFCFFSKDGFAYIIGYFIENMNRPQRWFFKDDSNLQRKKSLPGGQEIRSCGSQSLQGGEKKICLNSQESTGFLGGKYVNQIQDTLIFLALMNEKMLRL